MINFDALWKRVTKQYLGNIRTSVHGPTHWRRVERNGLFLAAQTGADPIVVRLFALFHDSRRENEYDDPEHGARGADYAAKLRGSAYDLDDASFRLLEEACIWHTDAKFSKNTTIGTCWDADRFDLDRVGIIPHPKFMSTRYGKKIAKAGLIEDFFP